MFKKIKTFVKNNKEIFVILFIVALFFIKFDYVIYAPGGKVDLIDRITINGERDSKGKLQMAYVSTRTVSLPTAIAALIIPNWDMYPNEDATYEGLTYEETFTVDKLFMKEAQDMAIIIAYEKAGKEIKLNGYKNTVAFISEEAHTDLKPLDEIIRINGTEMGRYNDISDYTKLLTPGDKVEIDVLRNGKEKKCNAVIYEMEGVPKIGVGIVKTFDFSADPEIKISSNERESGPSGGLMTALTVYNKLTDEDITKGRDIIGTGTIEENGVVGEIGGIKYKLLGAKGSDIFLCPKENEEEALSVKRKYKLDIEIKAVGTFDEAVEYLMGN